MPPWVQADQGLGSLELRGHASKAPSMSVGTMGMSVLGAIEDHQAHAGRASGPMVPSSERASPSGKILSMKPLVHPLDGGSDGASKSAEPRLHRKCIPELGEVVQKSALEKRIAGHVMNLPRRRNTDQPWIEKRLVIGDDHRNPPVL